MLKCYFCLPIENCFLLAFSNFKQRKGVKRFFWCLKKFFILKKSLKWDTVCVYILWNIRVIAILEKKNENAKNFFYGKINDFGEPFCVSQPSILAHIH